MSEPPLVEGTGDVVDPLGCGNLADLGLNIASGKEDLEEEHYMHMAVRCRCTGACAAPVLSIILRRYR